MLGAGAWGRGHAGEPHVHGTGAALSARRFGSASARDVWRPRGRGRDAGADGSRAYPRRIHRRSAHHPRHAGPARVHERFDRPTQGRHARSRQPQRDGRLPPPPHRARIRRPGPPRPAPLPRQLALRELPRPHQRGRQRVDPGTFRPGHVPRRGPALSTHLLLGGAGDLRETGRGPAEQIPRLPSLRLAICGAAPATPSSSPSARSDSASRSSRATASPKPRALRRATPCGASASRAPSVAPSPASRSPSSTTRAVSCPRACGGRSRSSAPRSCAGTSDDRMPRQR